MRWMHRRANLKGCVIAAIRPASSAGPEPATRQVHVWLIVLVWLSRWSKQ